MTLIIKGIIKKKMILNNNDCNYKKYNQKIVTRQIKLKKEVAEDINKIIAILNENSYGLTINNSILINITLESYFFFFFSLEEKEAIDLLKNKIIYFNLWEKP